jgi:hypothetical protein
MINKYLSAIMHLNLSLSLERNTRPSCTIDCGDQSIEKYVTDYFLHGIMPKVSPDYYDYMNDQLSVDDIDLFDRHYDIPDNYDTDYDYSDISVARDYKEEVEAYLKKADDEKLKKETAEKIEAENPPLTKSSENAKIKPIE